LYNIQQLLQVFHFLAVHYLFLCILLILMHHFNLHLSFQRLFMHFIANFFLLSSWVINQFDFHLVYFAILVTNLAIHQDQDNIKDDFFNLNYQKLMSHSYYDVLAFFNYAFFELLRSCRNCFIMIISVYQSWTYFCLYFIP